MRGNALVFLRRTEDDDLMILSPLPFSLLHLIFLPLQSHPAFLPHLVPLLLASLPFAPPPNFLLPPLLRPLPHPLLPPTHLPPSLSPPLIPLPLPIPPPLLPPPFPFSPPPPFDLHLPPLPLSQP